MLLFPRLPIPESGPLSEPDSGIGHRAPAMGIPKHFQYSSLGRAQIQGWGAIPELASFPGPDSGDASPPDMGWFLKPDSEP